MPRSIELVGQLRLERELHQIEVRWLDLLIDEKLLLQGIDLHEESRPCAAQRLVLS